MNLIVAKRSKAGTWAKAWDLIQQGDPSTATLSGAFTGGFDGCRQFIGGVLTSCS
jgi:hypothetical protein